MYNGPKTDLFGTPIIGEFRNENEFRSNFYLGAPLVWNGVRFSTSEHAYQWAKTIIPEEQESVLFNFFTSSDGSLIRVPSTPGQAKKAGKTVTRRDDWETYRVTAMYEILKAKFTQNWGLRQMLLNTGDAILIEGNTWHDNDWGSCQCKDCGGTGKNMLGKLLMQLREELRVRIYCHGCPVAPDAKL